MHMPCDELFCKTTECGAQNAESQKTTTEQKGHVESNSINNFRTKLRGEFESPHCATCATENLPVVPYKNRAMDRFMQLSVNKT